jgi:hypothetical protein
VDRLDNQVHPMIETLFPNNETVFQHDTVQFTQLELWFEEHEGKLQHLPWPIQSLDFNITEPIWSVLDTTPRKRFPLPTSLKQLEYVLEEE